MHPDPDLYAGVDAASAPAFSRDGRTLFHLRGPGLAQVWALDLHTGAARQLTHHDERVAFLRRAPGDDRIVYGIDAGGDERQQLWLLDGDATRPLTAEPGVIHAFGSWSPDGAQIALAANGRDEAHLDVQIMDIATGHRRTLWHGTHETAAGAWHPRDGRLIAVVDRNSGDQRPVILDTATGEAREMPRQGAARYASLRWAPDGEALIGLTDAGGRDFMALCRIDPATGAMETLHAPEGRDVEAWSLSPDGTALATVENDRGYGVLRVGAVGAEQPVVDLPPGLASDPAWSPDSATLAFAYAGPTRPASLWLWDKDGARPVWQPEAPPGCVEFALVEWESFDGRRIPGWLAVPPGPVPAAGHPAVVWVHGGPASQTRAAFRPDMQMLLALGYAVLMPNVRGSTGYGRAAMESDDRERRLDSVSDLAAGGRWLAAQPGIDPVRIAAMGQSYGGYMVLAAITEHPELWRAAIDLYGIADFITLLASTGPWRRAHRADEYGDPVRYRALFDRISPLRHAGRIACPLLVLHGERDPRVAIGESEQIVAALRARGASVEYETFGYAGHGFIRPEDKRRVYAAVAAFLDRHL